MRGWWGVRGEGGGCEGGSGGGCGGSTRGGQDDALWTSTPPRYVQGMDHMVHDLDIPASADNQVFRRRNMISALRVLLLAIEHVYGEDYNDTVGCIAYLGRSSREWSPPTRSIPASTSSSSTSREATSSLTRTRTPSPCS